MSEIDDIRKLSKALMLAGSTCSTDDVVRLVEAMADSFERLLEKVDTLTAQLAERDQRIAELEADLKRLQERQT